MKPTIENVVASKICVSCGMCQSICPMEAIKMSVTKDGFFHPVIDDTTCVKCGKCLSACPTQIKKANSLVGEYEEILLAHSSNHVVRHGATSGGAINSLLRFMLEREIIEAAVVVRSQEESDTGTESAIITKRDISDLLEKPRDYASRYIQIPVLTKIRECMRQYKRIAVVGTPCQIKALKNTGGV